MTPDLMQLGSNEAISNALVEIAVGMGKTEEELGEALVFAKRGGTRYNLIVSGEQAAHSLCYTQEVPVSIRNNAGVMFATNFFALKGCEEMEFYQYQVELVPEQSEATAWQVRRLVQSDEVKPRLEAEYGSIQESGFCFFASEEVK